MGLADNTLDLMDWIFHSCFSSKESCSKCEPWRNGLEVKKMEKKSIKFEDKEYVRGAEDRYSDFTICGMCDKPSVLTITEAFGIHGGVTPYRCIKHAIENGWIVEKKKVLTDKQKLALFQKITYEKPPMLWRELFKEEGLI